MQEMAADGEAAPQAPAEHPQEPEEHPATSRICVKNLPKYVDDRRLREHFAAKGEVTDAKVMRTRDGKSRCFGFVGFRSPVEAEAALRYFSKSFFDTMRLDIEFAYKFGSGDAPRAWSKYTAGSSAHAKLGATIMTGANDVPLGVAAGEARRERDSRKEKKKGRGPLEEEADPKLKEFMQVMQPRSRQAIWTNDDLLPPGTSATAAAAAAKQQQQAAAAAAEGGSDDEYEELPAGAGVAAAAAATRSSSSSEGDSDSDDGGGEAEEEGGDGVVRNAAVSDLDYLKSRVKASFDSDDEAFAAAGSGGAAAAAPAAGGDGDSSSSDEEAEEEEAQAAADATACKQQRKEAAAGSKQPKARRRAAADAADAELDAIFGGGGAAAGASESQGEGDDEMDVSGGEEEGEGDGMDVEGAGAGSGSSDEEAEAEEEEEEGVEAGDTEARGAARQQAGDGAQGPSVVEAEGEAHIADTGRLFVRNLPYTADESDLQQLFEAYGDVSEVHLVLDRASKKSKGFALVQYAQPQDAVKAHAELDASIFMGRLIHILPGKRPPPPPEAEAEGGEGGEGGERKGATSSFKVKKEAELKAGAGNRSAWNTLFMRADTVAEAVAAHYGVSKSELLDRDAGDMAVRLALGETQVIAETKRALAEAGADVAALEAAAAAGGKAAATRGVARSDSVLVVKNLPFSSSLEELETLFGAIGPLGRLVLPSTRTLALVEYLEAQDARRAFKALAYKRYQHVPLYLELAPKGIFSTPPVARPAAGTAATAAAVAPARSAPAEAAVAAGKGKEAAAGAEAVPAAAAAAAKKPGKADKAGKVAGELLTGVADAQAQADDVESSSIFVKNLAWATAEEALKAHFDAAVSAAGGTVRAVKVAKRKGPDGKMLSAGFGFVECSSESTAKAAVKALQGSSLDGHKLVLQLSLKKAGAGGDAAAAAGGKRKGSSSGGGTDGAADSSKVIVRNVAFEATRKDIMGLFTSFGHIKSCRLPRKFDGTHRGFAFVDFATKQEARNAMEAVQGAHLYGRRLLLEWAEEEGGLDELRAKTAAKYRGDGALDGGVAEEEEEAQPKQQQQQQQQQKKKRQRK